MVSVQVRNEDMAYLGKADAGAPQLHLRALATVNHKQLVAYLNHLCRRVVPECGKCAAAT